MELPHAEEKKVVESSRGLKDSMELVLALSPGSLHLVRSAIGALSKVELRLHATRVDSEYVWDEARYGTEPRNFAQNTY